MMQVIRKLGGSAFISGILVVIVMLAVWELTWLMFGASAMWSVLVAWSLIALLPFAIRVASICCTVPTERNALHR